MIFFTQVGCGGEFDATNVFETALSIICSVCKCPINHIRLEVYLNCAYGPVTHSLPGSFIPQRWTTLGFWAPPSRPSVATRLASSEQASQRLLDQECLCRPSRYLAQRMLLSLLCSCLVCCFIVANLQLSLYCLTNVSRMSPRAEARHCTRTIKRTKSSSLPCGSTMLVSLCNGGIFLFILLGLLPNLRSGANILILD